MMDWRKITERIGSLVESLRRDRRASLRSRRAQRGSELVEASLVLPIVFTVFLGLYSFGRGWNVYQSMTRAAREGLRQAVTTSCATCGNASYSTSQVQSQFVYPALQAVGINPSRVENYTQGYTWLDSSQKVCGEYISFQYPYVLKVPLLPASLANITLGTQVQMRLENQPNGTTCP